MNKLSALKNFVLIIALIAVVYIIGNYNGLAREQLFAVLKIPESSVKGASTERAQEISDQFKSDLTKQTLVLEGQILNLRVSDAISILSRVQKIPQDIHSIQEYINDQAGSVLKSKK